jgi:uncharacterized membrane protein
MSSKTNSEKELHEEWHSDPKNWICGVFYYNKNDKRIFPPKKHRHLGWTINFANPASVLTLVTILTLVIAFVVVMAPKV